MSILIWSYIYCSYGEKYSEYDTFYFIFVHFSVQHLIEARLLSESMRYKYINKLGISTEIFQFV